MCWSRWITSFLCELPFAHSTENAMVGCGPSLTTPTTLASRFGPAAPRLLSTAVLYTPLTSGPMALRCSREPSSLCHSPVTLQSNTCNTARKKIRMRVNWGHVITYIWFDIYIFILALLFCQSLELKLARKLSGTFLTKDRTKTRLTAS